MIAKIIVLTVMWFAVLFAAIFRKDDSCVPLGFMAAIITWCAL